MTDQRRFSPATLALGAAGLLAIASAAVAISRSHGDAPKAEPAAAQPEGTLAGRVAAQRAHLAQQPKDAAGWRNLGWLLVEAQDSAGAAAAYRKAAEVEPHNAENWSSLGEVLQTASATVQPEAAAAFERAVRLDPKDARARYFLAVQKDLKGDHEGAIRDWLALLKDTPPGAPWEADLRRTIQQVADQAKIDVSKRMPAQSASAAAANPPATATAAIPGPTPEQMAAASSIPPSQQDAMVKAMVDRLAARLASNPRNAPGWMQLMRAKMVLGDKDGARQALDRGLAAFRGDGRTQAQLREAASQLGVPGAL
jgi:cytochrome c-type biogenesis protein CcmH